MNEFIAMEDTAADIEAATQSQNEPSRPKAKRSARAKAKRRVSVRDLPDLSNLAALFDCIHRPKDDAQGDWDAALGKADKFGLAIVMDDEKIKGALLPFDTYNDLISMCSKAKGAE